MGSVANELMNAWQGSVWKRQHSLGEGRVGGTISKEKPEI